MNKYDLVRKKRDEMRNRRLERINRIRVSTLARNSEGIGRTFPPNRYQIDLQDMVQPELVIDIEVFTQGSQDQRENELLMIAHLPITDEMIVDDITSSDTPTGLMPEDEQKELASCEIQIESVEVPVIITEDVMVVSVISPEMLSQADDIRKLILLQETIKRFSNKKI